MNCCRSNSLLRNILYLRSNHQCLEDHITTQASLSRQFLQIRLDQFLNDTLHRVKMLSILLNSILKIFRLSIIARFSYFSLITIDHIIMNLKCIRQDSMKNHDRRSCESFLSIMLNHRLICTKSTRHCHCLIKLIKHFTTIRLLILSRVKLPLDNFIICQNLFEKFHLLLFGEVIKLLQLGNCFLVLHNFLL